MFQVRPAHPIQTKAIWDEDIATMTSFAAHQPSYPTNVQLPRTLQRPPYLEVPRQNITAVAPELADVAIEYIRRGLHLQATQMRAGIKALSPSHLPNSMSRTQVAHTRSLTIPLRPAHGQSISPPTHILALSMSGSSQDAPVLLVPTHAVVLAAQCARLPRLPAAAPAYPHATVSITLPVLPLAVPTPDAFAPLHTFLYDHSVRTLLSALLPSLPPSFLASLASGPTHMHEKQLRGVLASGTALHQLSAHLLSSRPDLTALTGVAKSVAAVWRNAVALGVHDPDLWDCLDLAWEVILGAMNLAVGAH